LEKKSPSMVYENGIHCDALLQLLLENCLINSTYIVRKLFENLQFILEDVLINNELWNDGNSLGVAMVRMMKIFSEGNNEVMLEKQRRAIVVHLGPCAEVVLKKAFDDVKLLKQNFPEPDTLFHLMCSVDFSEVEEKNFLQDPASTGESVSNNGTLPYFRQVLEPSSTTSNNNETQPSTSSSISKSAYSELLEMVHEMQSQNADLLLQSIMEILDSRDDQNFIQASLFDLLGSNNLDLIALICQNRNALVEHYTAMTLASTSVEKSKLRLRPNFQVISGKQKQEQREMQKLKEKINRFQKITNLTHDEMVPVTKSLEKGGHVLEVNEEQKILQRNSVVAKPKPEMPFVFDSEQAVQNGFSKICQGGTEFRYHPNYDMVTIQPTTEPCPFDNEECMLVENLDEITRQVFSQLRKLNPIQSIVFEKARKTKENLLICAPTGAGKTNVAIMCILRTLDDFIENGTLKQKNFKASNSIDIYIISMWLIIYLTPMKALAAEVVRTLDFRLKCLKVNVKEMTGDVMPTARELENTQILVATPEKWDVITRKGNDGLLPATEVRLFIIDEVHLLHENRGAVIETLVARMLRQV
ncbi:Activating signal cointegrator 1 complex subunit 3, partial [Trichinella patagoniensis]